MRVKTERDVLAWVLGIFIAVYLATYFHLLQELSYIKEKISEIQTQIVVVQVRLEIAIVLLILTIIVMIIGFALIYHKMESKGFIKKS